MVLKNYIVPIGSMQTRITIQQPTVATDAGGAKSVTWANITTNATVWSRWVNAHGQELLNSGASQNEQRATATLRYRSDILPTWRIKKNDDSSYWQILSVDHIQDKNRYTELLLERVRGTI